MKLRIVVLFGYLVVVGLPCVSFGKEMAATKAVTVTSDDHEIIVQCLGIKAKKTPSNSVRVYVHYRVRNNSLQDKFGILDFKAHCPFKNELGDLEGGFVVTNLGPEENAESENLWYFPQGCWDKVREVEFHWRKLPLDHPLNPKAR